MAEACDGNAPFRSDAAERLDRLCRETVARFRGGGAVSNLQSVGERITAKRLARQKKADDWAARLDEMDRLEPEIYARGDAVLDAADADMKGLEAELSTLGSNLPPLQSSPPKLPDGSGA